MIEYHSIVWMQLHSSVDKHLGCIHSLAVVNSVALKVTYKVLLEHLFSVLLELLSHGVSLYLTS